ncbi:MAG: hypothetical protein Q4A70_01215 [Candidatus Saccharibacteria bacterium]|nr:hypothetical protein [Candidatus Saccharibacteria bacterium]
MQEGNFEQEFMNRVQVAPANYENKNDRHNWFKIATIVLGILVVILAIVIIVILTTFEKAAPVECDCEETKTYGDYSVVRDENGNVKELLLFCKADDETIFELLDDYRFAERGTDGEYLDYGSYSIVDGVDIMIELSSNRADKYVYFDGNSLINMGKVYHCLYEEK